MTFFKNLKLTTEEDLIEEGIVESAVEEPIEEITPAEAAQDEIEAVEDAEEFQETVVAAEEATEEMESQQEVLENMQEQSDIIEEKLETPEEVTPEDVVVAQEAFAYSIGRISNSTRDYKEFKHSMRVSYESNNNNPAEVLRQLHTEGFKELMDSIKTSIAKLFAKIMEFIKKMMVKIYIIFGQSKKAVQKLQALIKQNPDAAVNHEEWKKVAQRKLSGVMYVLNAQKKSPSLKEAFSACVALKGAATNSIAIVKAGTEGTLTAKEFAEGFQLGLPYGGMQSATFNQYISFTAGNVESLQLDFDATAQNQSDMLKFTFDAKNVGKDPLPAGIVEFTNAKKYKDLNEPAAVIIKHADSIKQYVSDVEKIAKNFRIIIDAAKGLVNNNLAEKTENPRAFRFGVFLAHRAVVMILSRWSTSCIKSYVSTVRGATATLAAAMRPVKDAK